MIILAAVPGGITSVVVSLLLVPKGLCRRLRSGTLRPLFVEFRDSGIKSDKWIVGDVKIAKSG